jgi:hypothetical protein
MSNIQNERAKLTANWLNMLATALLAAGFLAPFGVVIFGMGSGTLPVSRTYLFMVSSLCLLAAVGLHLVGRWLLGRLRE